MRKKWTIEELQIEADKCLTRYEFCKNSKNAYTVSIKRKIMGELFKNHKNQGYSTKKHENWTKEKLQEKVNLYLTRGEFWEKEPNAATMALNKNIINELFKNHKNKGYTDKQKISGYWTKEKIQTEADKYLTRKDFLKNSPSVHSAYGKKIMDELFKNHINEGYLDKEEWKENSYVIYVYELTEFNNAYVGLTNNINRRDKDHVFNQNEKLNKFCKNNNIPYPKYIILEENLKSTEAVKKEKYWLDYYKNNGWEMFNIAKTGSLGSVHTKWTKKSLQIEANKYINRREYQIKNSASYKSATSNGLLDELFKYHKNNGYTKNKNGYWTKELLQIEAGKYLTRNKLYLNNGSAYNAALKLNILDEIFKHLPNNGYNTIKPQKRTKDEFQNEVNKYKNRKDFMENDIRTYKCVTKNGLLNELFKNHENNGYIRKKKSE